MATLDICSSAFFFWVSIILTTESIWVFTVLTYNNSIEVLSSDWEQISVQLLREFWQAFAFSIRGIIQGMVSMSKMWWSGESRKRSTFQDVLDYRLCLRMARQSRWGRPRVREVWPKTLNICQIDYSLMIIIYQIYMDIEYLTYYYSINSK